jgi:hypothetical protein
MGKLGLPAGAEAALNRIADRAHAFLVAHEPPRGPYQTAAER